MRALVLTLVVACQTTAAPSPPAAPAEPDPPGTTKWTETTNHAVGGCFVGVSNIFVRDGLGLSATFSIAEADGKERREFVKAGSVVVVCGVSIDVVRIDPSSNVPGAVHVLTNST
jgi:hypothetical protein